MSRLYIEKALGCFTIRRSVPFECLGFDELQKYKEKVQGTSTAFKQAVYSLVRQTKPHLFFKVFRLPHHTFVLPDDIIFVSPFERRLPPAWPSILSDRRFPSPADLTRLQWSLNTAPWVGFTPVGFDFDDPFVAPLQLREHVSYQMGTGARGQSIEPEMYQMKDIDRRAWNSIEATFLRVTAILLDRVQLPIDFLPIRPPSDYGYNKAYRNRVSFERAVRRSRDQFLPVMGVMRFAIALHQARYDEKACLPHMWEHLLHWPILLESEGIHPTWIHMFQKSYVYHAPSVGVIIDPLKCQWADLFAAYIVSSVPVWILVPPLDQHAALQRDLLVGHQFVSFFPMQKEVEFARASVTQTCLWGQADTLDEIEGSDAHLSVATAEATQVASEVKNLETDNDEEDSDFMPETDTILDMTPEAFIQSKEASVAHRFSTGSNSERLSWMARNNAAREGNRHDRFTPVKARIYIIKYGQGRCVHRQVYRHASADTWAEYPESQRWYDYVHNVWYLKEYELSTPIYHIEDQPGGEQDNSDEGIELPTPEHASISSSVMHLAMVYNGVRAAPNALLLDPLPLVLSERYFLAELQVPSVSVLDRAQISFLANVFAVSNRDIKEMAPPTSLTDFAQRVVYNTSSQIEPSASSSSTPPLASSSSLVAATEHHPSTLVALPKKGKRVHSCWKESECRLSELSHQDIRIQSPFVIRELKLRKLGTKEAEASLWYTIRVGDEDDSSPLYCIGLEDPVTALQCMCSWPSALTLQHLACELLKRGMAFRTFRCKVYDAMLVDGGATLRTQTVAKGLGQRPEKYKPDYADYLAYLVERESVFADQSALRAAFLMGGLPWRMAVDYVGEINAELIGTGPVGRHGHYEFLLYDDKHCYYDDELSPEQKAILSGVYRVRTPTKLGKATETNMSWFPSIAKWFSSTEAIGYWTRRNEEFFQKHTQNIQRLANAQYEEGAFGVLEPTASSNDEHVTVKQPLLTSHQWKNHLKNAKLSHAFEKVVRPQAAVHARRLCRSVVQGSPTA
ncbi:hypothetical protein OE88DRAFT_1643139 [Heliocybe sulcata]|uniref:Uncharacterized protein n=1 Tax=Heliocybe sulcata TaxID=5364 RepID=A0A5C3N6Q7_9AGAM|nr:hypothetical protein OE88DRAFT_1643139 [Heliocybe sulcata]